MCKSREIVRTPTDLYRSLVATLSKAVEGKHSVTWGDLSDAVKASGVVLPEPQKWLHVRACWQHEFERKGKFKRDLSDLHVERYVTK